MLKLRRLEEEVNLPNLVGKLMRPVDRVGCRKGLFFFVRTVQVTSCQFARTTRLNEWTPPTPKEEAAGKEEETNPSSP